MKPLTWLEPMKLENIKTRVNAAHPGSWHWIEYIDGAPIEVPTKKGTSNFFISTKKCLVRFKIGYETLATVQLDRAVRSAASAADMIAVKKMVEEMSAEQLKYIAPKTLRILKEKADAVKAGIKDGEYPLIASKVHSYTRVHDPDASYLTRCANGSILLNCYASFAQDIVTGKYRTSESRYYLKTKDGALLIDPATSNEKLREAIKKAHAASRIAAGKSVDAAALSPFYTINIKNVIAIDDKKE